MSQSQYASQSNSWEVFKCWTAAQDRWSSHKYNNGSFYIFTHTLTASNSNRFHLKKKKKKRTATEKNKQKNTARRHPHTSLWHQSLPWSLTLVVWISRRAEQESSLEIRLNQHLIKVRDRERDVCSEYTKVCVLPALFKDWENCCCAWTTRATLNCLSCTCSYTVLDISVSVLFFFSFACLWGDAPAGVTGFQSVRLSTSKRFMTLKGDALRIQLNPRLWVNMCLLSVTLHPTSSKHQQQQGKKGADVETYWSLWVKHESLSKLKTNFVDF